MTRILKTLLSLRLLLNLKIIQILLLLIKQAPKYKQVIQTKHRYQILQSMFPIIKTFQAN